MKCFARYGLLFSLSMSALTDKGFASFSIDEFGAIPDVQTLDAAKANAHALEKALLAANAANQNPDNEARTVQVPSGSQYFILPVSVENLQNVHLKVDGDLIAHGVLEDWPKEGGSLDDQGVFNFKHGRGLRISGSGSLDGQGYEWWVRTIFNTLPNGRPHLVYMDDMRDTIIEGIQASNSPQFHFLLKNMNGLHIHDITIKVDTSSQKKLLERSGFWQRGLPTFPLNTDGIDPSGRDILIENVEIENFDDAVVVKPTNGSSAKYGLNCSENIVVRKSRVKYGVGMSIGSVPPHPEKNCVRNIRFEDINFEQPFKAIYIKTNPGDEGSGIIENVSYRKIVINRPIWWAIYIGPQQQKQPDGYGPGCMLYPLDSDCPTQPRVTIRNIQLSSVQIKNGLLLPGIIRCDAKNPCSDIVFDRVIGTGGLSGLPYICENVQGASIQSNPAPSCFGAIR